MMEQIQAKTSQGKNTIYILLSDYPDKVSRMLKRIGFWTYSHASICCDGETMRYFSFTGKHGFRAEDPCAHPTYKGQSVPCALYAIPVSDEVFKRAVEELEKFSESGEHFDYCYFGLVLMYLGLRFNTKKKYTCVGFVSSLLERSDALSPKLCKRLVKPDDVAKRLRAYNVFKGTLKQCFAKKRALILS